MGVKVGQVGDVFPLTWSDFLKELKRLKAPEIKKYTPDPKNSRVYCLDRVSLKKSLRFIEANRLKMNKKFEHIYALLQTQIHKYKGDVEIRL